MQYIFLGYEQYPLENLRQNGAQRELGIYYIGKTVYQSPQMSSYTHGIHIWS